jgi:pectate lyase
VKLLLATLLGSLLFFCACGSSRSNTSIATGGAPTQSGGSATGGTPGGSGGASASGGTLGSGGSAGSGAVPEPGTTYIQEDELGFSGVEGKVLPRQGSTSITGYTGTGFSDSDSGFGKSISWNVKAEAAGPYSLVFRYAFGGTETNLRDAQLSINGAVASQSPNFAYTGSWNDWLETEPVTVDFVQGPNFIRLTALYESGLANIDYIKILGPGITGDTPSYSVTLTQNDPAGGVVSLSPMADYYAKGDSVTLTAVANPGFFFQSWSGDVTGAKAELSFPVQQNTHVTAIFLPVGTEPDPALVGYASVQDDAGTPYLVTGGSLGEAVTASTLDELKTYLESPEPYVVSFEGLFEGATDIHIASNKTLVGVGDSAHLKGIELEINGSRNVIVRNVAVSHVIADGAGVANDAIVITGAAKNIWIDHCELFSDLEHGKDYYDGLLEIKNESSFVTVSYCYFHDHYKVSLISSGEEQVGDTVIRATYHHNYFRNCNSRLPSIRFGKAHVFDNYYEGISGGSCINSRMGAVVKAESNYFSASKDPIGFADSARTGFWEVNDNTYDGCTGSQPTVSTGTLNVPYMYAVDPVASVPSLVTENAGVGKL